MERYHIMGSSSMAIISEVYFSKIDKDWDSRTIEYDADQKV